MLNFAHLHKVVAVHGFEVAASHFLTRGDTFELGSLGASAVVEQGNGGHGVEFAQILEDRD